MIIKLLDKKTCDEACAYIFDLKNKGMLKNEEVHHFGPDNHKSFKLYSDSFFEDLAIKVKPKLEESVNTELYPTYTYTRLYREGFILAPHKDRPACEYSATITIGYGDRDYPWEFHMENSNGDQEEYSLEVGEGILYRGCDYRHWRYALDKGWQIQSFVHYIKLGGEIYDEIVAKWPDYDFNTPFNDFDKINGELYVE